MLYYCFTTDLVTNRPGDDSLLQYTYAQRLNRALLLDLSSGNVLCNGKPFDVRDQGILLRTTSDRAEDAFEIIKELGGQLAEDLQAVQQLKHWFVFFPPTRRMASFDSLDEMLVRYSSGKIPWLACESRIFIKTLRKGYSRVVNTRDLFSDFFMDRTASSIKRSDEIVISQVEEIQRDSFGNKEWRCFVRHGQVQNISRYFHSLHHIIPEEITDAAARQVVSFRSHGFPLSDYVMDLMMTEDGRIEIVELNPLSSSMCYINNSVFTEAVDCVTDIHQAYGFGYEYCLDYLVNPGQYHLSPQAGVQYTYSSDSP